MGGRVLRFWFNRTYSTNSHVISMLRDNPDGRAVHVVGTHSDPDSPVLAACDEQFPEPRELTGRDYAHWALDFAREHSIDVFVPLTALADIADARERFASAGVTVLCPPAAAVRLFGDKGTAYLAAGQLGLPVPPHDVVGDSAGLRAAYKRMGDFAEVVCMKPVSAVGGRGFRFLSAAPPDLSELVGSWRPRADLDRACAALDAAHQQGREVPALLVMPYLTGPEISMDVLADRTGEPLAVIGRTRSRRRRVLVDDRVARDVAERLTRAHGVAFLSNTQVRYWQGPEDAEPLPYLLELNTRISGGLFQTMLSGVNLPWAAVRLALGEDVGTLHPTYDVGFTTISSLVALDYGA
jgi:biotin carboxylase